MSEDDHKNAREDSAGSPDLKSLLPTCPIVAIGASAGGVDALQELFGALPGGLNAAFVVIVHLDPQRQSELAEIIARRASMPVTQVSESMKLRPNCVYVIPPNRRLLISDHEIATAEFDEPRGRRLPIDFFFRSMAEQRGDGVAIVLTGSGSDGAIGIKAVKEAGGVVLVQEPLEASYNSMPTSAIATGVADFVLPMRDLAARLVELLRSKEQIRASEAGLDDGQTVSRILGQLRARTGHDFSGYKHSTIVRRLARRMQISKTNRLEEYLKYLYENAEEVQALFADLLISVTAFFRDPGAFDVLAADVIPKIFDAKPAGEGIRIWVPGCATGEEAYSVGMLFLDECSRRGQSRDIQIFASDLDAGALATAREGRYPLGIEADISEARIRKYFLREAEHYRVKKELRDIVLFAMHSLLKDPPFSRLDLVSCRNLLIYLDRDIQQQAANTLAYALLPGGYLFLGPSEGIESSVKSVRVIDRQARIFQTTERTRARIPELVGQDHTPTLLPPVANLSREYGRIDEQHTHRQALEAFAPPSVLVDSESRIIHLSESAGRYLLHPGGPLTSDLAELARPELRLDLRAGLHRAFETNRASLSPPIPVQFNGTARQVYLQVRPISSEDPVRRALVLFIEGEQIEEPTAGEADLDDGELGNARAIRHLREELNSAGVRLRESRRQYGEAIEELRAANEELQSTNEEYRSTAEELETSKEELQSTNEELQTVNNELKHKLEAVSRAHSDIENLITSSDVGTLFLDRDLRINRFTPQISKVFNLVPGDEGRPITDFTHQLEYDDFASDARSIFEQLTPLEHEIRSKSNRWYLTRLRPYRSTEDKIEGIVITLVDITAKRQVEEKLRESEARLSFELAAAQHLHNISTLLIQEGDVQALYEKIVGAAAELMHSDAASMQVLDRERNQLRLTAWKGFHPESAAFWEWVRVDSMSSCGVAMGAGKRVIIPDVNLSDFMADTDDLDYYHRSEIRSVQSTPLVSRAGALVGMLSTHWRAPHEPSVSDLRLFDVLARQAADLIERRQSEKDLHQRLVQSRFLLDELNHRVKNTLATIQSIAMQTLRNATNAVEGREVLDARLMALSKAHDVLTREHWSGASLHDLISIAVSAYPGDGIESRFEIEGENIRLVPKSALAFSMALHELATNATKYGALSAQHGRIRINWWVDHDEPARFHLQWTESGGPLVTEPRRTGFGARLLRQGLAQDIGGKVELNFERQGLVCTLDAPLDEISGGLDSEVSVSFGDRPGD